MNTSWCPTECELLRASVDLAHGAGGWLVHGNGHSVHVQVPGAASRLLEPRGRDGQSVLPARVAFVAHSDI